MKANPLAHFWPLLHSVIREFWALTEPPIEEAAIRNGIPFELYTYSEFGADTFSTGEFQKRDPFTNPALFEKTFATLNFKGWIEPIPDDCYRVTSKAHEAIRKIVQAGDAVLLSFETSANVNLFRLALLLRQIVQANEAAPEPPEKWAIFHRLRIAGKGSPLILQIREYLMDILAYRDDSHISAAHPHFGRAGIVWLILGLLFRRETLTAEQAAEILSLRGYETSQYEIALQAAAEIGWAQETSVPGVFSITQMGRELHASVERLTDTYFFGPWSILLPGELEELHDLLSKLREELNSFRRAA